MLRNVIRGDVLVRGVLRVAMQSSLWMCYEERYGCVTGCNAGCVSEWRCLGRWKIFSYNEEYRFASPAASKVEAGFVAFRLHLDYTMRGEVVARRGGKGGGRGGRGTHESFGRFVALPVLPLDIAREGVREWSRGRLHRGGPGRAGPDG